MDLVQETTLERNWLTNEAEEHATELQLQLKHAIPKVAQVCFEIQLIKLTKLLIYNLKIYDSKSYSINLFQNRVMTGSGIRTKCKLTAEENARLALVRKCSFKIDFVVIYKC